MQKRSKMCASRSSGVRASGDLLERRARVLQIGEHEFLRQRAAIGCARRTAREQRLVRALEPARCGGRS